MLVLSRDINEVVIIGDLIKIEILTIRGNNAKLGSIAPKSVPIFREEIYERIKREQQMMRK